MAKYEEIKTAMEELDEEVLLELAEQIIKDGGADAEICMKACQEGIKEVGNLFESGEYFVGDLVFAGELMTQVMEIIKPAIRGSEQKPIGRMIICTVKDDLHDIGKNIVRAMLEAAGFEVLDLGIDVAPETIVQAAKDKDINIIALSGVLTLAANSMKDTVDAFIDAGMRDKVHIIVGGNPVNAAVCETIGADAWAIPPQETIRVCTAWASESA